MWQRSSISSIVASVKKPLSSLGSVCAIIGAQWGDEGKGKVIDVLAAEADIVARAVGGANAGHTVLIGTKKFVFHLLPTGVLRPKVVNFIGGGAVVHLPSLLEEIASIEKQGVNLEGRLFLSHQAHIILNAHKEADTALEERRGKAKIGTTKRGIGPAMGSKALRIGVRIGDLFDPATLKDKVTAELDLLSQMFGILTNPDQEMADLLAGLNGTREYIADTAAILHDALTGKKKKRILIEGAQGSMLDLDHGTYPYVTSSATTTAGALQGLGLPPQIVTSVIGVLKAYTTRVGEGPFPTELQGADADRIRERGGEYGSTTGRPRRCGHLDLAAVKPVVWLNGITHVNLTKLDVLDAEDVIPVCIGYEKGMPRYEKLPGWKTSTRGFTAWKDLPPNAKNYITFIEKFLKVPVMLIGTGQGREEMIVRS